MKIRVEKSFAQINKVETIKELIESMIIWQYRVWKINMECGFEYEKPYTEKMLHEYKSTEKVEIELGISAENERMLAEMEASSKNFSLEEILGVFFHNTVIEG